MRVLARRHSTAAQQLKPVEDEADFAASLRESQHGEAQRLAEDEESLQDILSVTSDIGAASTNIGLQWLVIFLAAAAIGVAIWAALKASGASG